MPELPEVETIRNELRPFVVGRTIKKVTIADAHAVKQPGPAEFARGLTGQRIVDIERRGKYLIFPLSGGDRMVVHLKMSGALLLDMPETRRYLRAVLDFADGNQLILTDKRRFARIWLTEDIGSVTNKLGPEPLEKAFTYKVFLGRLKGRKAPIKAVLLDQKFIAGVGNMYADEALFSAGIHPLRPADGLSAKETRRLYDAILEVLLAAIRDKGASIESYIRPHGNLGTAHFRFRVAHQRGKLCPVCGTAVQRIAIRGRGSYFCPKCQV